MLQLDCGQWCDRYRSDEYIPSASPKEAIVGLSSRGCRGGGGPWGMYEKTPILSEYDKRPNKISHKIAATLIYL